jgi:hypothetical protein
MEPTTKALEEKLGAEMQKNAMLEDTLAAKEAQIEELTAQLAAKTPSANVAPAPENKPSEDLTKTFALGGKNYRVSVSEVRHEGETITASEILADKTLQKEFVELLAKGYGVVEEVK